MATLEAKAVMVLKAAAAAPDGLLDVYLDTQRLVVVKVRDGKCVPEDFVAAAVEKDEARFIEVPVVTTIEEHLWMRDFVDELADRRIAGFLDGRAGANDRFRQQLTKNAPDVLAAWEAFRMERVHEMVDSWLADLGIAAA